MSKLSANIILFLWLAMASPVLAGFVDNGDGTVTDSDTGLMWTQATQGGMGWEYAIDYCETLEFAGYDDWRLPNRNELQSLVDYSTYSPAIDTSFFPDTECSYYWSSTVYANYSGYSWYVHFSGGSVSSHDCQSNTYYVRAVRAGQCRSLDHLIILTPRQAETWKPGTDQTITWETRDIEGNVSITLSRSGGDEGSFETIASSTDNDGSFEWTVTEPESVNCVLKIEPLDNPDKATTQGLFSIKYPPAILTGTVTSLPYFTGLSGVTVTSDSGETTTTDGNGLYSFELSSGTREVTFSLSAYETVVVSDLTLGKNETHELDVQMTEPGPLNMETTNLTASELDNEYTCQISWGGGTYPYTFFIAYGALPDGLSLDDQTGTISGTPESSGAFTFAVGIEDADGSYAEREFTLEVTSELAITTEALEERATEDESYSASFEASGGTQPYTFSRSGGSLPSGLSLSSDGLLSGSPRYDGTYAFIVKVTDASGREAEKAFELAVDEPLDITSSTLNDGISGESYSFGLGASGGYGEYTWQIYSGTLPAGLSLDTGIGEISGTPSAATTAAFIVAVSDGAGRITYQDFQISVCNPLEIVTNTLPTALKDSLFSEAVVITGGISDYTFSYDGQLPDGLSLDSATGIISGTPTMAGYNNITISVTDSTWPDEQTVTQTLGIRISSSLTVTTSAVLPDSLVDDTISPVVLSAGGGPSPYTWQLTGGALPGGISLDTDSGELSGTPTQSGDFVFTLTVTDDNGTTSEKEFTWHVWDTLEITSGAVMDGAKDLSYSDLIEARGGRQPYTWQLKSGTLPDGLSLNASTGALIGTPTTRQTYSFTVEVRDSFSPAQTCEKTFSIDIQDELFIQTSSIPNGRTDEAYTASIIAQLGDPPYSWRLESGVLPHGLELSYSSNTATIQGTPTAPGDYTFSLEITDSGTPVSEAVKEFTMTVYGELGFTTDSLENAVKGIEYSDSVTVAGGEQPYTWSVSGGSLPSGLTLNPDTGHISGTTDEVAGHSAEFTVQVTDSGNPWATVEKEFSIVVVDPMAITTGELPGAMEDIPYEVTFEGEGGVSPHTWYIESGDLPDGLSLDAQTGVLSGTPEQCGTFSFTLGLADDSDPAETITRAYSLEVICAALTEMTVILTNAEPDTTISTDYSAVVYCSSGINSITIESGAHVELLYAVGANTITIQEDSVGFTVSRSGAMVILEGPNDTLCKIPATTTAQTIIFNDSAYSLVTSGGSVMLGTQAVQLTPAAVSQDAGT